jgi:vacuolar protein-sorting-associated protein 4
MSATLARAKDLALKARQADENKQYELALTLYTRSLVLFEQTIKNKDPSPTVKEVIKSLQLEYTKRAEDIKVLLHEQKTNKVTQLSNNSTTKGVAHRTDTTNGNISTNAVGSGAYGQRRDAACDLDENGKLQESLMSCIVSETPNVKWSDIAGLKIAKQLIYETVVIPIRFPHLFTKERTPWKAILLYGPPGTGKTQLAKAVATEAKNSHFLSVSSSDLVSKFQGESERLVKQLFQLARDKKPSIVFIDEVDSICSARSEGENDSTKRIKNEFLLQMQGVGKDNTGILILGATNNPWELDTGFRRRFEKRVYIPLPGRKSRETIIRLSLGSISHTLSNDELHILAEETTVGCSGADINTFVRDAIYEPVRELQCATYFKYNNEEKNWSICESTDPHAVEKTLMNMKADEHVAQPPVTFQHFLNVSKQLKPTVSQKDLEKYTNWTTEFGINSD